ncbi:GAP family protein [Microbacterium sp. LRZ72]|uniref:GAP family protein n=1 Tax=Microbacterium sp. LRZ72 TaxID=2942481 RepID=UPI0029BA85E0|nr:GAP family protein [Microbacterium sp. LRZ72]MDX2377104.1 GAP family protein [Microbacterium sp. LRZ72]
MESVLWYVIPLGVAMALSVLPILAAVLILLAPDPVPLGVAYLAGWAAGVLVLVTLFAAGARIIPAVSTGPMPPWAHVAEAVLGVLLVCYAAWALLHPRARPTETPSWTRALQSLSPRRAVLFGLVMNVRPKNLTLAVAAGIAIGSASIDTLSSAVSAVIFTAVGVSTVAGLVVAYLLGDKRVRPVLETLSVWLQSHTALVLHLSVLLIGGLLIWLGLSQVLAV